MNKNKSKAAYTNKWLNRNKHLWKEVPQPYNCNVKHIVLLTDSAPTIVGERVREINKKRSEKKRIEVLQRNLEERRTQRNKLKHKTIPIENMDLSEIFKDDD